MRRFRVWLHRLPRPDPSPARVLAMGLTVAIGAVLLTSCATPTEVRNKRVLKTKWVDGKVVYVLESEADAIKRGVDEGHEAGKDVVIDPAKPKAEALPSSQEPDQPSPRP